TRPHLHGSRAVCSQEYRSALAGSMDRFGYTIEWLGMKLYVVTSPDSIRGIYPTWAECKAAVSGVPGARYQAVSSREAAEAMLRGEAIRLTPGSYAFVDGNHLGGIGVVLVTQGAEDPLAVKEVA